MAGPSETAGARARDLACVVHVHSTYSDGTATVPEIIDAARAAGADAVLLTDHDSLGAQRDGWEGWHDGVLLVVGLEVTTRRGHFLAFGVDAEIDHSGLSEREIAAAVRSAGGVGFPAHPFSTGSRISRRIGRPHPWSDLESGDFDGIEVWSAVTEAAERCAGLRELVRFVRRPHAASDHLPASNLAAWDRLAQRRRVVGIGGLDAHQTGLRLPGNRVVSPFPHTPVFRTLRTHVVLERPPARDGGVDRDGVLDALRAGRCYLAVDSLADARGFEFFAAADDGGSLPMGGEAGADGQRLSVQTPHPADLRIVCDGEPVAAGEGRRLEHRAERPGVYRVEARIGGRPWIVSNPIYLR